MAVRPLLPAAGAAWLGTLALAVLLCSPAFRIFDAGWLPYDAELQSFAERLLPDVWLSGVPHSPATVAATWLYLAIVAVMYGSWAWALWTARTLDVCSPLPLIGLTAIIAAPLVVAPGLHSDDVYLYNSYGRAIAMYGANPILVPPSAFPSDPHLSWVHWTELPSSYGPIWLWLSALVSALAGDSIDAVVVLYRLTGLGLHLVTITVLWRLLRDQRHGPVLPAVLFYAWNPLVLVEVVGNAHNDGLVALFALALVGATMQWRWSRAAVYAACAVMVKPFALILAPIVARQLWQHPDPATRYRRLVIAAAVGLVVVLALNLPLGSGEALVRNALDNPAASLYANSLWELGANALVVGEDVDLQHPGLDVVRGLAFVAGVTWVLTRRVRRRDAAQTAVRVWLVFCLTACWVWPWYFVPLLALSPVAGTAFLPAARALTIGGLLFWAAWPERRVDPLQPLYAWRSVLLFGPLLLTWLWVPARSVARLALGPSREDGASRYRSPELDAFDRVISTAPARERTVKV